MWLRRKITRQHFVAALVIMAFAGSLVGGLWYLAASLKNGMHEYYQRLNAR